MNINLPEDFVKAMKQLLGSEYEAYVNSFDEPRVYGLRVNTLKWTPDACQQAMNCSLEKIPWIENGFFYDETCRMAKEPYYYAGLYYLQEPSAMTPASVLPVKPGDMVLDLCAAPGGKSTELGARLQGKGMLLANDISHSRAKALLKNLELFGIPNICVTSESPQKLAEVFQSFFDKILIDAPCSGEGMFRKEPDMVNDWLEKGPEYYSRIQREIVSQAIPMLKDGGYLLYSTCTFSVLEDEGTVEWILTQYPEMEPVSVPRFEGAQDGIGLSGCIRLFPHKIRGEGHFLALLRKKKTGETENAAASEAEAFESAESAAFKSAVSESAACKKKCAPGDLALVQDFLKETKLSWDGSRFRVIQDMVYYLPEGFPETAGLRYLRTGLWVGTLKKGRFEPSQALAMVLGPKTYEKSISFSRDDDRVIRYLKGETISLKDEEEPVKGWCLVCVDGYALGFAKGAGMTLKNKYYPGWRWQ